MAAASSTDRYARGFSEMAAEYVDLTPQARRLVDLAGVTGGERVLDVGCGPGTATVLAATAVGPAGFVVGGDLAAGMLARARAAVVDVAQAGLVAMDGRTLAFADETFDVVLANSVVQFTGPGSLGEWRRVVRPGGRVACSLPDGPRWWFELCHAYVDRTAEPFRSRFRARLETGLRGLDPEGARAAAGFSSVEAVVDPLVRRHRDAEAAWQSEYRHGARVFLEELPADVLPAFKAEYLQRVGAGEAAIEFEWHSWCFTR